MSWALTNPSYGNGITVIATSAYMNPSRIHPYGNGIDPLTLYEDPFRDESVHVQWYDGRVDRNPTGMRDGGGADRRD